MAVTMTGAALEARLLAPGLAPRAMRLEQALRDGEGLCPRTGLPQLPSYRMRGLGHLQVALWKRAILSGSGAAALAPISQAAPEIDRPAARADEWRWLLATPGVATLHKLKRLAPAQLPLFDPADAGRDDGPPAAPGLCGLPTSFQARHLADLYCAFARHEHLAPAADVFDPRSLVAPAAAPTAAIVAEAAPAAAQMRGRSSLFLVVQENGPLQAGVSGFGLEQSRGDQESFAWISGADLTRPSERETLIDLAEHVNTHIHLLALATRTMEAIAALSSPTEDEDPAHAKALAKSMWRKSLLSIAPLWAFGADADLPKPILDCLDAAFGLQQKWRDAWSLGHMLINALDH